MTLGNPPRDRDGDPICPLCDSLLVECDDGLWRCSWSVEAEAYVMTVLRQALIDAGTPVELIDGVKP